LSQYVALLRGINLGARHKVPMADLRELLGGAGYENVRTLLQSGNVVFESDETADALERALASLIGERFGFAVPVIVRTAEELRDVVASDPLAAVASDPKRYAVVFLSAEPNADALGQVAARFAENHFAVRGREIYAWNPDGLTGSGLMQALGKAELAPVNTVRNWATVTKLAAMLD